MTLSLDLTLRSDAALTERNATIGGHRTLRWIPGTAILGAAGAALYQRLPPGIAWRIFHSGEVRFHNALPVREGLPTWPVPLSLFHPKREPRRSSAGALSEAVRNLARFEAPPDVQWKQIREGLVDGTLRLGDVEVRESMRTAIGAQGRARDGFLFEIQALPAGLRCRTRVEGPADLLAHVAEALVGQGISVGRSRAAEFGAVAVDRAPEPHVPPPSGPPRERDALFWCLSDLALRDPATGQPSLRPSPEHFGLPVGWRLDLHRSFLRHRRYAGYVGPWRRPGLDRQVLVAGSVLVFARGSDADPLDPSVVARRVGAGIGEYTSEGLGEVVWEPILLGGDTPQGWATAPAVAPAAPTPPSPPEDALGRWLGRRAAERARLDRAWSLAMEWSRVLQGWDPIPPSQWGEVRDLARRHREAATPAPLRDALRAFTSDGVRKLENRWGGRKRGGPGGPTLGERLVSIVGTCGEDGSTASQALELLAIHIARAQRLPEGDRP